MSDFKVHVLGCGSAKPSTRHNPSCSVVEHRGNLFMVDCGEGAQKSFQQQRLRFSRLNHIFLTHLHGDHVFGLPGLIGTLALSGITGDITIHTFEEGRRILSEILGFFSRELPIEVKFDVIKPADAVIYENSALRVRTVRLNHRVPAVGYVFEEKPKERHIIREMTDYHRVPVSWMRRIKRGEDFVRDDGFVVPNHILTSPPTPSKTYAHISDTAYMPGLHEKIRGADLLFHETTYLADCEREARERFHSTAAQAAAVARDAGAGRLLTGHYSSRIKDEELIRREAESVFPNVILGREGLTVEV